jgi:hypothetical protein
MNLVSPSWWLKTRCSCCHENGELCFTTCPKCNYVFLVCSEVSTVYPNPKDLTQSIFGAYSESSFVCPNCKTASDFRDSTIDEIQQLGFTVDDYE